MQAYRNLLVGIHIQKLNLLKGLLLQMKFVSLPNLGVQAFVILNYYGDFSYVESRFNVKKLEMTAEALAASHKAFAR